MNQTNIISSYDEAKNIVEADRRRYWFLYASGCIQTMSKAALIATVAVPVLFFWIALVYGDQLGNHTMLEFIASGTVRQIAGVAWLLLFGVALATMPTFDVAIRSEVDRLSNVMLAKNLALDAVQHFS